MSPWIALCSLCPRLGSSQGGRGADAGSWDFQKEPTDFPSCVTTRRDSGKPSQAQVKPYNRRTSVARGGHLNPTADFPPRFTKLPGTETPSCVLQASRDRQSPGHPPQGGPVSPYSLISLKVYT